MANQFLVINITTKIGSDKDHITAGATSVTSFEQALLQRVIPVDVGVGSNYLPRGYGFDPLNLAETDQILEVQIFLSKYCYATPSSFLISIV